MPAATITRIIRRRSVVAPHASFAGLNHAQGIPLRPLLCVHWSFSAAPAAGSASDNINFAAGSAEVDLPGQQKLRVHAQRLQENPDLIVTLIGHTDNLGSRAYNVAIAEKRIESVSALLRSYGVAKKQLRRYAVGNERLDKSCQTAACRQKMRRVELSYPK